MFLKLPPSSEAPYNIKKGDFFMRSKNLFFSTILYTIHFCMIYASFFTYTTLASQTLSFNVIDIIILSEEGESPAWCESLHITKTTFGYEGKLPDFFNKAKPHSSLDPLSRHLPLTYVLVRTEKDCQTFLFEQSIPPLHSFLSHTLFKNPGEIRFIIDSQGDLQLYTSGKKMYEIQPHTPFCLSHIREESSPSSCTAFLTYYPHLTFTAPFTTSVKDVTVEDVDSGIFEGPGDIRQYDVFIPKAGTLIVEYVVKKGPSFTALSMETKDLRRAPGGSMTLLHPGHIRVTFTYYGPGPSPYDIGFLFTPDEPLACALKLVSSRDSTLSIRLDVWNTFPEPVQAPLPDVGTIEWYGDGKLIAGAHPGRPSFQHVFPPQKHFSKTIDLKLPFPVRTLHARIQGQKSPVECRLLIPQTEK